MTDSNCKLTMLFLLVFMRVIIMIVILLGVRMVL
jgi:hypothetical protein